MAFWTFPSDDQGWGSNWTGAEGRPAGCLVSSGIISGLSISVNPGDPNSFWARIIWDGEEELVSPVEVDVLLASNGGLVSITDSRTISSRPYDSGWFKVFGAATGSGTVTGLNIGHAESEPDWPGSVYFDSIYVAESEPGGYELTHSAGGLPGNVIV